MQLTKEIFLKLKESVAFFASFTAGELLALLKIAETESFNEGEIVFKENTRGDKMYIILSGTVRISKYLGNKQEEVLVKLLPGACFGEMGLIDQSPRSARATAEGSQTVVLSLKETLLSQHNILLSYKLYRNFAVMLSQRLRETNDKLQNAAIEDRSSSAQLKEIMKKGISQGASFQGANLKGADLSEAFMNNSNLKDAVLIGANFKATKCKQANFSGAKLVSANFSELTFEGGNFQNADFTGAVFKSVHFQACNMTKANFKGADLNDTIKDDVKPSYAAKKKLGN
ncbi:MAG: pentapeptide repeat-containing protein [Deltaproteobacteria bacterium]|nr:pentapeptide repeat-containing protein [Deltaproteobacteria bacterium]